MLRKWLDAFGGDDAGSAAIEYALIAGIVSLVVVGGLTSSRNSVNTTLTNIGSELKGNSSN